MFYNRQNKVEIEIKVLDHDKTKGLRQEEKNVTEERQTSSL